MHSPAPRPTIGIMADTEELDYDDDCLGDEDDDEEEHSSYDDDEEADAADGSSPEFPAIVGVALSVARACKKEGTPLPPVTPACVYALKEYFQAGLVPSRPRFRAISLTNPQIRCALCKRWAPGGRTKQFIRGCSGVSLIGGRERGPGGPRRAGRALYMPPTVSFTLFNQAQAGFAKRKQSSPNAALIITESDGQGGRERPAMDNRA